MSSDTLLASILDRSVAKLSHDVGCDEPASSAAAPSTSNVPLRFDPQTKGAGGYQDGALDHKPWVGPQNALSKLAFSTWANRCTIVPREHAALKQFLVEGKLPEVAWDPDQFLWLIGIAAVWSRFGGRITGGRITRSADTGNDGIGPPSGGSGGPAGSLPRAKPPAESLQGKDSADRIWEFYRGETIETSPQTFMIGDKQAIVDLVHVAETFEDKIHYFLVYEGKVIEELVLEQGKKLSPLVQAEHLRRFIPYHVGKFFLPKEFAATPPPSQVIPQQVFKVLQTAKSELRPLTAQITGFDEPIEKVTVRVFQMRNGDIHYLAFLGEEGGVFSRSYPLSPEVSKLKFLKDFTRHAKKKIMEAGPVDGETGFVGEPLGPVENWRIEVKWVE